MDNRRNFRSICKSFALEKDRKGHYIGVDQNDRASSCIMSFFSWLHPVLVNPSKPNSKFAHEPVLTPREYMELRLASPSPMLSALYSLSTCRNIEKYRDNILNGTEDTSHQNHFLAAAAASDILMRSNLDKANCFQLMLGECLDRQSASKEFKKLCSAFHLAPSIKFSISKHIRGELGKVYTKGLELNVEHSVATIPKQDAEKLEATQLRNKDASSGSSASLPYARVTDDFIKAYTKISSMDLWTPEKTPIIGKSANGPVYAKADTLEVPGRQGGSLHSSILSCITDLGNKRVRDYFNVNYIQTSNRVQRTEKKEDGGVSLAKMNTTVKRLEEEKHLRILKATSTSKAEIKKNIKIADITDEYKKLRVASNGVTLGALKTTNHDGYANALAAARKKVFKKHSNMKNEIIASIEQEYKENELSKEADRVSTLKDHLFTFPRDVHDNERYRESNNCTAMFTEIVYHSTSLHSPGMDVVTQILYDLFHGFAGGCPGPSLPILRPVGIELFLGVDFGDV
eukprot:scaffold6570_cov108-Skeletonema_dohrnii-CCMP3373.AAC.1